jgi:hypothetical protein
MQVAAAKAAELAALTADEDEGAAGVGGGAASTVTATSTAAAQAGALPMPTAATGGKWLVKRKKLELMVRA